MMKPKILTDVQVEQFINRGYTKVQAAFPVDKALAAQDFLWQKLESRNVKKSDRATWTQPMVRIQENYGDPVFQECMTDRLCDAIEDLVGPGRWKNRNVRPELWGWWPVNFAHGADKPWDVPTSGWHWDGQHFRHFVDAPDQGLLLLCMFSDIQTRGGGTLVAEGSHQIVARYLRDHPDTELKEGIKAVNASHPWINALTNPDDRADRIQRFMQKTTVDADGTRLRVVETTAAPGDIFLCHPFLYHAASPNHSGKPRFMCNKVTPLTALMQFHRPDADYSPLEISIRKALKIS